MRWVNSFIEMNAQKFLDKIEDKCLIVCTNSSIKNLSLVKANFIICNAFQFEKKTKDIINFASSIEFDRVIGVGGGTAIDTAKYIAYVLNKPIDAIITMLSTNVYATNKACLIEDVEKVTLQAKTPDHVVFDEDLIKKAGIYNMWGLFDVLSIHTALWDWKIADAYGVEKINKYYNRAKHLLEYTINFILKNYKMLDKNLKEEYHLIAESGEITNLYGSGRPESGSEHIFAKEIEKRILNIPHGLAVINGIHEMSIIQNNVDENIEKIIELIELDKINKQYNIDKKMIKEIKENLKPRKDRFTVIDTL